MSLLSQDDTLCILQTAKAAVHVITIFYDPLTLQHKIMHPMLLGFYSVVLGEFL